MNRHIKSRTLAVAVALLVGGAAQAAIVITGAGTLPLGSVGIDMSLSIVNLTFK